MSTELELGKLRLAVAKSDLEVLSTTTAFFSHPEGQDGQPARLALGLHMLEQVWVRRGRGLQLQIKVSVDGRSLTSADLRSLSSVLCQAKVDRYSF